MRKFSICILGGTGFVGTRLVSRLIREGHRVTVLTRNRELHKHLLVLPGLSLLDCDVYDAATWSAPFPLSGLSVAQGSAPIAFPDFTRGT